MFLAQELKRRESSPPPSLMKVCKLLCEADLAVLQASFHQICVALKPVFVVFSEYSNAQRNMVAHKVFATIDRMIDDVSSVENNPVAKFLEESLKKRWQNEESGRFFWKTVRLLDPNVMRAAVGYDATLVPGDGKSRRVVPFDELKTALPKCQFTERDWQMYQGHATKTATNTNVKLFWERYPDSVLGEYCLDLLATPPTITACDSTLSSAGCLFPKERARLSLEKRKSLLFHRLNQDITGHYNRESSRRYLRSQFPQSLQEDVDDTSTFAQICWDVSLLNPEAATDYCLAVVEKERLKRNSSSSDSDSDSDSESSNDTSGSSSGTSSSSESDGSDHTDWPPKKVHRPG